MALQKQPVTINFAKGVDTKSDPYQVPLGSFLELVNTVFTTTGRLSKRNGYANITTLPNENQTILTTYNDNLIATGSNLYSYNKDIHEWYDKGTVQPVDLSVQSLLRSSTSQVSPDSAIAENGLVCLAYMDAGASYYQISDSMTGEQVVSRTLLPNGATDPRVFILKRFFIVTFKSVVTATNHLQYVAIPLANPTTPGTTQDISSSVAASAGYDAVTANNALYFVWAGASTTIKLAYLTVPGWGASSQVLSSAVTISSKTATLMSVTADESGSAPVIWASFWDSGSTDGYSMAYDAQLNAILTPTQIITGTSIAEITSVATDST